MHRIEPNRSALHSSRLGASNDGSHVQNGPIPEIFRLFEKKFMHIWGILLRNFYLNFKQHQRCFELIFKTRQFFGVESSQVAGCKCVRKNNVEASWDYKKNLIVMQHPDKIFLENTSLRHAWCWQMLCLLTILSISLLLGVLSPKVEPWDGSIFRFSRKWLFTLGSTISLRFT